LAIAGGDEFLVVFVVAGADAERFFGCDKWAEDAEEQKV
jgi:hypothetical protein